MSALEDNLVCLCARQQFTLDHRRRADELLLQKEIDWSLVISTVIAHAIAPLFYRNIANCRGVPEGILQQLQLSLLQNMQAKEDRLRRLMSVMPLLKTLSIKVMFVKGAAMDQLVYTNPYLTTSEDLDIVFGRPEKDFPPDLLEEIHHKFYRSAVEYDFFDHHDITMNGLLQVDFAEVWSRARPFELRGEQFFIPSTEDLLLSSCVNSCRKRFFKLKTLVDIQELVEGELEIDWPQFINMAHRYGCLLIVYGAFKAAELRLGLPMPTALKQTPYLSSRRRGLIDILFESLLHEHLLKHTHRPTFERFDFTRHLLVLLPYATYSWRQMVKKPWYIGRIYFERRHYRREVAKLGR